MRRLTFIPAAAFLFACGDTPTESVVPPTAAAPADEVVDCSIQNNNTVGKLTDCVTLEGVRSHQAALQAIADASGGARQAGTAGYEASVDNVRGILEGAGYDVTLEPTDYLAFRQLGPSTLEQTAPGFQVYVEGVDFQLLSFTPSGDATGPVTAVDRALGLGNASTSGCEASDLAGFTPGHIALLQRGACFFEVKTLNAEAAGAAGVIIFNQGNTESRLGLINGTLGTGFTGATPVLDATYALGEQLAATPGLAVRMGTDVSNGTITTYTVLAETPDGDPSNVVMAGAHLDSEEDSPGINDNGSGVAALLEVAVQMSRVRPRNKVRFAFWTGHEDRLSGSEDYVAGLSEAERGAIALHLDFHMIGSPNHGYFVLDGDGSEFNPGGALEASGAIESFFGEFYQARGLPSEPTEIDLDSDYTEFFSAGIPVGGIFTGAEAIKTPEQAALYGGTAGDAFDPSFHLRCDTFDNVSLQALDVNSDAVATSVLQYAMSTEAVNGRRGKGNFGTRGGGPAGPGPAGLEGVVR